ncbi:MAG: glutathionylspermidine synthase family protein [Candidatus Omnitrophica bacterium]|nr:glutathionylspermidine synthase family protein [Candidatus Omnitrophota bacterium]
MVKNLDHAYDEYLKAREEIAVKSIQAFPDRLKDTHFRYGRVIIPTFYKSHFLSPKQAHLLKRAAKTLHQVINSATRLYFEEGHLGHIFRIKPEEARLIKIDPGYTQNVVFSRFNTILEGESLKVLEFNCDSPAGAAYADQLEDIWRGEETVREFWDKYHIVGTNRSQDVLDALLAAYEEFGGYETPNIAIMDWHRVRTVPEFEYLKAYFESKGYKTTIADPRELKYKGGHLYHKNMKIRLILRRAFFQEILDRLDDVEDLIRAYEDKAVCMVNSLRSRLAGKALHSLLSHPEYEHFFTDSENRVKREHIPWTRRLTDAEDFYGHKKIYLIDFLKDEKETLVLKPSHGSGGQGVTLGLETRDDDWNAAIDRALKGDWIVQEYVNVPIMTVPVAINNKLDFAYKKYNFNMLVFGGKYAGAFTRLSDESVVNVAKKGGMILSLLSDHIPERM